MTDPHGRFQAWLAGDARGEPPRDIAMHASGCDTCLAMAAGVDALTAVDVGRAALPAKRASARRPLFTPPAIEPRQAATATLIGGLLVMTVVVTIGEMGRDRPPLFGTASPAPRTNEGVLGGAVGPGTTGGVIESSRDPSPSGEPAAGDPDSPASGDESTPIGPPAPPPPPTPGEAVTQPPTPSPTAGAGSPPSSSPTPTPPPDESSAPPSEAPSATEAPSEPVATASPEETPSP